MALTTLAGAWLGGLLAGLAWPVPGGVLALWGVSVAALAGLVVASRLAAARPRRRPMLWACAALGAALLGTWWGGHHAGAAATPELEALARDGAIVRLRGQVADDPELRGTAYRFRVSALEVWEGDGPPPSWRPVAGALLVTATPPPSLARARMPPLYRYGDRLLLAGGVEEAPAFDGFDYRDFLARQGVAGVMGFPSSTLLDEGRGSWPLERLYWLRARLAGALGTSLPEPHASLVKALLLGLRADIPQDLREAFQRTGAAHLLAISGLHVAVVLGLLLPLGAAVAGGGRVHLALALGGLWLFAALAGMGVPVTRAAIMGSLYLAGRALGREGSGMPPLALAAAVMAGVEPRVLGQVSFQLSFTAVASLVLVAPTLQRRLERLAGPMADPERAGGSVVRGAIGALAASVAASLGTAPLLAYAFGRVTPLAVPVTLLAVPALPPLLLGGGLTAALGLAWHPLGVVAGWVTWAPSSYLLGLVAAFGAAPWLTFQVGAVAPLAVAGYYAAGLLLLWRLGRGAPSAPGWPTPRAAPAPGLPRLPFRWAAPPLALAAALLWGAALSAPDGLLRVGFLDVGQGDSIFIRTPSGRQVLVDGGPDPRPLLRQMGERMPFWDRSLDLVVLTHPESDHLAGLLGALERYRVGVVMAPAVESGSSLYVRWQRLLGEQPEGMQVVTARSGQRLDLGDGVVVEVLGPPGELPTWTPSLSNNGSVVLRVSYGRVSFLLTGDVEAWREAAMVAEGAPLEATVLKVAHHGSATSSTMGFLRAVAPAVAVISVGEGNRFGHPDAGVLERLRAVLPSGGLLTTAEAGTVELATDGLRLYVRPQRPG